MAEKKAKTDKKESKKAAKKFWKIAGPNWAKSILKLKDETSERYLKAMKSKGYEVEEA